MPESKSELARKSEEDRPELRLEPPIVARLVVEIRSDGRRTIARGAAEDRLTGQRVSLAAEGRTPLALLASLLKSALELPALARALARRGFLTGPKRR